MLEAIRKALTAVVNGRTRRSTGMSTDSGEAAEGERSIRWRHVVSNAALGSFVTVRLISYVASLVDEFRLSVLLMIAFYALIVVLTVVRRATVTTDRRAFAVLVAWGAAFSPLLMRPTTGADLLPGQVLQVAGFTLQVIGVISLGRSFGVVASNRGIKTGGAYRFVRHPLYSAYFLADVGFVVNHPSLLNLVIILGATTLQIVRISIEEQHLRQSPEYREYCARQPWRLIPGVW